MSRPGSGAARMGDDEREKLFASYMESHSSPSNSNSNNNNKYSSSNASEEQSSAKEISRGEARRRNRTARRKAFRSGVDDIAGYRARSEKALRYSQDALKDSDLKPGSVALNPAAGQTPEQMAAAIVDEMQRREQSFTQRDQELADAMAQVQEVVDAGGPGAKAAKFTANTAVPLIQSAPAMAADMLLTAAVPVGAIGKTATVTLPKILGTAVKGEGRAAAKQALEWAGKLTKNAITNPTTASRLDTYYEQAYREALNNGASEEEARATALRTAIPSAAIESMGGPDAVARSIRAGETFGGQLAKAALKSAREEGMEEVLQGVTGRLAEQSVYNPDATVLDPSQMWQEFRVGAIGGGLMGGAGRMAQGAINGPSVSEPAVEQQSPSANSATGTNANAAVNATPNPNSATPLGANPPVSAQPSKAETDLQDLQANIARINARLNGNVNGFERAQLQEMLTVNQQEAQRLMQQIAAERASAQAAAQPAATADEAAVPAPNTITAGVRPRRTTAAEDAVLADELFPEEEIPVPEETNPLAEYLEPASRAYARGGRAGLTGYLNQLREENFASAIGNQSEGPYAFSDENVKDFRKRANEQGKAVQEALKSGQADEIERTAQTLYDDNAAADTEAFANSEGELKRQLMDKGYTSTQAREIIKAADAIYRKRIANETAILKTAGRPEERETIERPVVSQQEQNIQRIKAEYSRDMGVTDNPRRLTRDFRRRMEAAGADQFEIDNAIAAASRTQLPPPGIGSVAERQPQEAAEPPRAVEQKQTEPSGQLTREQIDAEIRRIMQEDADSGTETQTEPETQGNTINRAEVEKAISNYAKNMRRTKNAERTTSNFVAKMQGLGVSQEEIDGVVDKYAPVTADDIGQMLTDEQPAENLRPAPLGAEKKTSIPDENSGPKYSLNNETDATMEDERVDKLADALMERLQSRGVLDRFERTALSEGVEGEQSGRSIKVNSELSGTTREANAALHEVVHLAARQDSELVPDIIRSMRRNGVDVDSLVEERRNSYLDSGLELGEEASRDGYFEEEVAAAMFGGMGEENTKLLNKVAAEEPGLIRRIIEALRNVWNNLTGKQKSECEQYIDRLNKALENTGNVTVDMDTRYAIHRGVDEDRSGNVVNARNAGTISQETYDAANENRYYTPQSQKETTQEISDWYEREIKNGHDPVISLLNKKPKDWRPKDLMRATFMTKVLDKEGRTDLAGQLASAALTSQENQGRAIAYLRTLAKENPRALPMAIRADARKAGIELDEVLTEQEKREITALGEMIGDIFVRESKITASDENGPIFSPETQKWLREASEYVNSGLLSMEELAAGRMAQITNKYIPPEWQSKLRTLQAVSMLANARTQVKNITTNAFEAIGTAVSRPFAKFIDSNVLSKITGHHTYGSDEAHYKGFWNGAMEGISQAKMNLDLGLETVDNRYSEDSKNSALLGIARKHAFSEDQTNALLRQGAHLINVANDTVQFGLAMGDAPFLYAAYEGALADFMSGHPELTAPTKEIDDAAWKIAEEVTFRGDNKIVQLLLDTRRASGVVGLTIAPYLKAPANGVIRAIEYSPIGAVEGILRCCVGKNSLKSLKECGESTLALQRHCADLIARGAFGTFCMAIGALLRARGVATGDDEEGSDKYEKFKSASGNVANAFRMGDTWINFSSVQSFGSALNAGAAGWDASNEEVDWGNFAEAMLKGSVKMGNTMLDLPVLQGMEDLFGGKYSGEGILLILSSLTADLAQQLIPFASTSRQLAKTVDPYARNTSVIDEDSDIKELFKTTVNEVRSIIPGVRETLPERYDVLGEARRNDAGDTLAERAFNEFINPFQTTKARDDEITTEIGRLYDEFINADEDLANSVLPRSAPTNMIGGYELSTAEREQYQKDEGEVTTELLKSVINSDLYLNLDEEAKADVLEKVYSYAADVAKGRFMTDKGEDYEPSADWYGEVDRLVETGGMDMGDAIIHYANLSHFQGYDKEGRASYIFHSGATKQQMDMMDDAFISDWMTIPDKSTRDYTNKDTFNLSMTSDSGRRHYYAYFSDMMTTEEYRGFYDAYNIGQDASAEERRLSIADWLINYYGMDEKSAYDYAGQLRKLQAKRVSK